jgi:diguanylate cyclase (GGDEF)-like protein
VPTMNTPLLAWLPRGMGIPHETWVVRHRWVVRILALQCVGLVLFADFRGFGLQHGLVEIVLPGLMVALASWSRLSKTTRSAVAAAGLMFVSTTLVHLSDGYIEAHFHFFVMLPIVALYESWVPFMVAVWIVLLHHGVMGSRDPGAVFNHPAAIAHPWTWAGIHALAILAACLGAVVNWRAQEQLREAQAVLSDQLLHQASHDAVTQLPSRTLFADRLEKEMRIAEKLSSQVSILELDMDGFKEVNDMFGHSSGDLVLQEVARRLTDVVRPQDMVTRMGGDEYAILLVGADAVAAERTAARLAEVLVAPFDLGGASVDLEVSIGIAAAQPGDSAATLMRNADTAMYHAKEQRLGRARYDRELPMLTVGAHTGNRLSLLGDLRRALHDNEISLHYQPKVDLATGRMTGTEALARWQHPVRGLLQPATFIDMVDRTNLSRQFTAQVLDLALSQVAHWGDQGLEVPVAVNLARRCLFDTSLAESVSHSLSEHAIPPRLLILEITEMTLVSDPEQVVQTLHELRSLGVKVSLDDFGTGYSSLSYLKDLPIDELKIDRSFVADLTDASSRASILVRAAIELAHNLGLTVVAEGVEDAETQRLLAGLGCDQVQGFHIARPMPASELAEWLARAPQVWQRRSRMPSTASGRP